MIQETSKLAFTNEIRPKLGKMQREVYKTLQEYGSLTNSEIANKLGWTINRTTPRTNELVKRNVVENGGKIKDTITGRTCIAWKIKTNGMLF